MPKGRVERGHCFARSTKLHRQSNRVNQSSSLQLACFDYLTVKGNLVDNRPTEQIVHVENIISKPLFPYSKESLSERLWKPCRRQG
ncbi:hypothetical protein AVEN_30566-1 [Araneus ventricosus]|uniref:Uncharacterized protein n=1 Tax=Araneus ventricosus TaxID=182803 RepID=A0A4Y2H8K6_ARAVE|nr:hypothetical protein AVEN_30566-1 [Araneus ventricosus]